MLKSGILNPDSTALHRRVRHTNALVIADHIGYPVIVRPSFVLGGRAMKIVYDPKDMENFTRLAILFSAIHHKPIQIIPVFEPHGNL